MSKSLKIILAEDNPNDAELLLRELRQAGFDPVWDRVDTEVEYTGRLAEGVDLIISDFEMPQFNGLRALELLKASGLDIPFIIVSGTIGEDTAVAAMKQGAADYLLKDRLTRLGPAVCHALEQNRNRRERREAIKKIHESEEKLRNIFDGISAFLGVFSTDGRVVEINQAALRVAGLRREEIIGRLFVEGPWWSHSTEVQETISTAIALAAQGDSPNRELMAVVSGQTMMLDATFSPLRDGTGRITQIVASGTDITVRKQGERKIREQLAELLRWQGVMLDREDRVHALKTEVNELLARENMPLRYSNPIAP